jgi:hypothetical protein
MCELLAHNLLFSVLFFKNCSNLSLNAAPLGGHKEILDLLFEAN